MIYIDEIVEYNLGRNCTKWCSLFADSVEELHKFAKSIGVKKEWFHNTNQRYPHYDLEPSKRRMAIRKGAKEMNIFDFIRKRR